jgi:hypothetical protein
MLTNYELEEIANHYGMALNDVVMKDEMKSITPRNGNYIINLQSSSQGNGTHWCALCIKDKDIFYFDSFGIICPSEITNFCKRIPKSSLAYNDLQIQHIDAQTCGWFCIIFLLHLNRSKKDIYKSASEFIGTFSYLTNKNDAMLKQYFRGLSDSRGLPLLSKLYSQK